jgi:hypothetical protein
MEETLKYGFVLPELLVPAEDVNLKKWSCVACDQFTSQPKYWESVKKLAGGAPSSFHIMLPEIYLEEEDVADRIIRMKQVMRDLLRMELRPAEGICWWKACGGQGAQGHNACDGPGTV